MVMTMYIRVKRNKTTYFLQCDPMETVLDIKEKLCTLVGRSANDQRLFFMGKDLSNGTKELLDDSKTLAEQKVENDVIVAVSLRKDDGEFEDINIVQPSD